VSLANDDFDGIRQAFIDSEAKYKVLAEAVEKRLDEHLRSARLTFRVDARTKELHKCMLKVLRKSYTDPLNQLRDRAGIRVTVPYLDDVEQAVAVVREHFAVLHEENKISSLDPNELGYLGWHFEVTLRPDDLRGETHLEGLVAEIQVHTAAQNAWATVSHELIYKPPTESSQPVQRQIMRLLALVELFDGEVERARHALVTEPTFEEGRMLGVLEREFYAFLGRDYDREVSLVVLGVIKDALTDTQRDQFAQLMAEFVARNRTKLQTIYERYWTDDRWNSVLLFQPEALAVFERLESAPMLLRSRWDQTLPPELLTALGDILGVAI
jgi:ppGpp synthetase/RelA/SpoT-type nucleotidyltranferase